MMLKRWFAWIIIGVAAACAVSQGPPRIDKAPAESPPSSYRGLQYVDSRGCIFVRSGKVSEVAWVPRLNQKRQHICSRSNPQTVVRDGRAATPDTPIKPIESVEGEQNYVQASIFPQDFDHTGMVSSFKSDGYPVVIRQLSDGGSIYKIILLGPYTNDQKLEDAIMYLRSNGFHDAFYTH